MTMNIENGQIEFILRLESVKYKTFHFMNLGSTSEDTSRDTTLPIRVLHAILYIVPLSRETEGSIKIPHKTVL